MGSLIHSALDRCGQRSALAVAVSSGRSSVVRPRGMSELANEHRFDDGRVPREPGGAIRLYDTVCEPRMRTLSFLPQLKVALQKYR